MENRNNTQSKTSTLRQQAEALLKKQHEEANLTSTEADLLKLIHELKVHQIELEQQNEELKPGKSCAQEAVDLYDLAPTGYLNEICSTDYDLQGNPVRSFDIVQDVTAPKQTEIQLQINEAQKNAILNGISANIAFVDKDLKIIWANKTAADSVNKTPDEMIGQTCHHFWGDPSKPCEACPTLKAFVSKKPEQTLMTTPDGKIWEEKGEPIFDVNGNLIGVVEIATDVTDRKHSEDELRISEERYRLLAENSRDVIWTMKLDGTITYGHL